MDTALSADDVDGCVRADERFHRTLIDLAGNARLAAMAFTVWEQGHRPTPCRPAAQPPAKPVGCSGGLTSRLPLLDRRP
jgi:DNA-binding FadR family transcriptional regulator